MNKVLLEQLRSLGLPFTLLTPIVQSARDTEEISPEVVAAFGNLLRASTTLTMACDDQLDPGWQYRDDDDRAETSRILPPPDEQG